MSNPPWPRNPAKKQNRAKAENPRDPIHNVMGRHASKRRRRVAGGKGGHSSWANLNYTVHDRSVRRHSQVVRQWIANPSFSSSNLDAGSTSCGSLWSLSRFFWGSSPVAEARDLKSLQRGFESRLPYSSCESKIFQACHQRNPPTTF